MIDSFQGTYRFLSNFHREPEEDWRSREHFYQAAKTHNTYWKARILMAEKPEGAKHLGSHVLPPEEIRPDWDTIKLAVMEQIVFDYFFNRPRMAGKLVGTLPHDLIEGNLRHDNFWGMCSCTQCKDKQKTNHLGRILMRVRDQLLLYTSLLTAKVYPTSTLSSSEAESPKATT